MPSLDENKALWDKSYDWSRAGEEWSREWGSSYMQWHGTLLPRMRAFLPAASVLEIAPGHGRWTRFLKDFCSRLSIVDLSATCIEACRRRFAGASNISYFVNDGRSLDMVPDGSVDFIFSFDSLVHAESNVISDYVAQFSRKLTSNGVAFVHHSNAGVYARQIARQKQLLRIPKLFGLLRRIGAVEDLQRQWRATSMTAEKMRSYTGQNDLLCINQELVNWGTRYALIDCLSTIVRPGSKWGQDTRLLSNASFMNEAEHLAKLARLYDFELRN